MMYKKLGLAAFLLAATGGTSAYGTVIALYQGATFNDSANDTVDVTASAMTNGGGLSAFTAGANDGYPTQPNYHFNPSATQTTNVVDTAFDTTNDFFQFTITPQVGKTLNLTSLTFDAARGGSSSVRNTGVRSSATGTTDLLNTTIAAVRPTFSNFSVDLSSVSALQNVTSSTPVTFKIAVATGGSGASLEFDNITLNANVVPEPASIGLLAAGGLLLLRRRVRLSPKAV